jgi:uncharacterized membrane protein YfcA
VASAELIQLVLLLAAAGVAAGVLAGLLGVGGGIVLVPVLDLAFGAAGVPDAVRMHLAVGTSLASIVPTALSSARAHWHRGGIDPAVAMSWSPAIAVGATLGAWLASRVGGAVLSMVFAVVALGAALRMLLGSGGSGEAFDRGASRARWWPLPVAIGTVSSMMGIGGGTLSVPALSALGLPVHRAVGTSAWLGLWIALPAAIGFAWLGRGEDGLPAFSAGHVNLLALAVLLPATVLAAPLGAKLAHSLSRRQLSVAFGVFLLVSALRMFYRAATG